MSKKPNGHGATLDQRIAAVIASDDCDKAELSKVVEEAEQAITEAKATIQSESAAALDISNADPDSSDLAVRKAQRTIARLDQALPKLRDRIKSIELFEYREQWNAAANKIEAARDELAAELADLYPAVVEQLSDLFARIGQNSEAIDRLHAAAPSAAWGENQRRLLDAELKARGLEHYDGVHPPLRANLKLPSWDISRECAFPVVEDWNARAAVMAAGFASRLAEKFAVSHSADWVAARELEIKEQEAEHAKRDAELQRQAAAKKASYDRQVQEADRRRRLGLAGEVHE